ncbi:MAG: hypothetical protein JWP25_2756 [Bradyrhizobium sp.]|nr:hypothetical protein [Bradyrhizobium sp.]
MLRGSNSTLKRLPEIRMENVVLDCTIAHYAFLLDDISSTGGPQFGSLSV